MSGELITALAGKVPQRAIRHLDALPYVVTYQLDEDNIIAGVDFGGANETFIINTHNSKRAKVIEILVYDITENFAGTTKARVDIGDGSDANGFAFTDDFVDAEMTTSVGSKHYSTAAGSISPGVLGDIIQPDDQVTITCVASITGPTGIGRVAVSFFYFD